jgi:4-carboxymuconolactone decarboxylase
VSSETTQSPALPDDVYPESLSRLPLVKREELDEQGRRFYDASVGPQSRTLVGLQGPSGISLHTPFVGEHLRAINQYLRYETGLERRLTELAILVTARELDQQFEWTAHEPVALKEGLAPEIVDVVKHRKPIDGIGAPEAAIIRFGREVFRLKKVSAQTFADAQRMFGRPGVVNLAALMANYAGTAIMLNAVDQQLRPGQPPLLPID